MELIISTCQLDSSTINHEKTWDQVCELATENILYYYFTFYYFTLIYLCKLFCIC